MKKIIIILSIFTLAILPVGGAFANDKDPGELRAEIDNMASETLQRLYKQSPTAKGAIAAAYGYAVFDNFGLKIFLLGGGKGHGVAVTNQGQRTYMKMLEVQGGCGLGAKGFSLIVVFDNADVFNSFVNKGWEFGGQATAAAKVEDKGGAMQGAAAVQPGIWMYQLTDQGLEAAITLKGTKYYKDDELN